MIIKMHIDLLPSTLRRHRIKHLQPRRVLPELRILGQHLSQHPRPVGLPQRLDKGLLQGDVLPLPSVVGVNLVDHLDRKRQADRVHAQALDLGHNRRDALVLQALGHHDVVVARPVGPRVGKVPARRVADPSS